MWRTAVVVSCRRREGARGRRGGGTRNKKDSSHVLIGSGFFEFLFGVPNTSTSDPSSVPLGRAPKHPTSSKQQINKTVARNGPSLFFQNQRKLRSVSPFHTLEKFLARFSRTIFTSIYLLLALSRAAQFGSIWFGCSVLFVHVTGSAVPHVDWLAPNLAPSTKPAHCSSAHTAQTTRQRHVGPHGIYYAPSHLVLLST